jgi:hypothetical protein
MIAPAAVSTDLAVEVALAMWTARLRTDREAIFRTSVFRILNAAGSIALAVAEVSAAAALEGIVLAVGVVVALAVSAAVAVAGSGADGEDNAWNFPVLFLEKLKPQTNQ